MRKIKRKYKSPRTPWNTTQIKEERKLLMEFGLRRKKELWKAQATLRNFRRRARLLIAAANKEEEKILIQKMEKLGFITKQDATLDDILALNIKNILNRRLQTLVYKKGIAKGVKHARQLITHGHVYIGGKKTKHPAYLVATEEEDKIGITERHEKIGKPDAKLENS